MYDDDAQPIVSAVFIAIDLIIFMIMVSGMVLFFKAGYAINGVSRNNMVSRELVSASRSTAKTDQYTAHERTNAGDRITAANKFNTSDVHYDGIMTGEEVYNSLLSMNDYYDAVKDGVPSEAPNYGTDTISFGASGHKAIFTDVKLGEDGKPKLFGSGSIQGSLKMQVRIRNSQYANPVNLGQAGDHDGFSILRYAQDMDSSTLLDTNGGYVDLGTSDDPTYYKCTIGTYAYTDSSGVYHNTQQVSWVMYTKVS